MTTPLTCDDFIKAAKISASLIEGLLMTIRINPAIDENISAMLLYRLFFDLGKMLIVTKQFDQDNLIKCFLGNLKIELTPLERLEPADRSIH